MAAAATDLVTRASNGVRPLPTTVSGIRNAGGTTLSCSALTGWATATAVHFITYKIDVNGKKVAGSQVDWKGIVSGTNIGSLVARGGTDAGNAIGDVVEAAPTAAWADDIALALLQDHSPLGQHVQLTDSNGKKIVGLNPVTNSVNDLIVSNAAAGGSPDIAAEGTDTNIGITLTPKGSGSVAVNKRFDGWTLGLPTPSSVTYNGNRSYTAVWNGTDLTGYISNGMRLRAIRTSTAPAQCTSLDGATQYYSRASASLTGMTFTGSHTIMGWVKISSYPTVDAAIVQRTDNSTGGFALTIKTDGRIRAFYGGASAFTDFFSYHAIPLNRWVHVAASVNAAAKTVVMLIDGAVVPTTSTLSAATSLVQTSNLEIGRLGTGFVPGKIAQVAVFSTNIATATLQGYISQGLAGTETSLVSAYSLSNSVNDLNANANTLTANGSALATNPDSPFGQQADGTTAGTTEYGIVTRTAFSTNTTLTIQVPEGCALPTSGSISAVAYSTQKAPQGMPISRAKWRIDYTFRSNVSSAALTGGAWNNMVQLPAFPTGDFIIGYQLTMENARAAAGATTLVTTLSTANNSETESRLTMGFGLSSATDQYSQIMAQADISLATPTTYYVNTWYDGAGGARTGIFMLGNASQGRSVVWAELALL